MWREGKLIASTTDTQGRIAGAALELNSQKIVVVSVYAPNVDGTHKSWEEYTKFLVTLEMHIDKLCNKANTDNVIVNGDFNIILNIDLDSHSQNPKVYNIPKEALIDMTDRLSLSDAFRVLNGDMKTYTFAPGAQNVNKIYNRLDYAWVSDGVLDMAQDCLHLTVGNTDHKAVVLKMTTGNKNKTARGLWRHNDQLNTNTDFLEIFDSKIKIAIDEAKTLGSDQAVFEYIKFKMGVISREFSADFMKKERLEKARLLKVIDNSSPDDESDTIIQAKDDLQAILDREGERELCTDQGLTEW